VVEKMASYSFGAFVLDLESRILFRDGEPVVTTGKTLDTLAVLVQNRGRVLDKDELLSRLWPNTVVEEANLTQSIFTLRKVLGDNPKNPRYIATIAGRGYQFVDAVVEVSPPLKLRGKASNQGEASVSQRRRFLWRAGAGLGAILVTSVATWFWINGLTFNTAGQPSTPVPFTSLLGRADSPAFSPDGKEIAYAWTQEDYGDRSIYVKLIGAGTELRLTTPPGRDFSPRWSPDGQYIAFYRIASAATGYYIVSVLGGAVRPLLRTNSDYVGGLDWSADGKRLVIVENPVQTSDAQPLVQGAHSVRLVAVDIDTGARTVLTTPPIGALGDVEPRFSPDGRKLAFVRVLGGGNAEVYLLNLNGDPPRRLTNYGVGIGGIDWTPDSREIVFGLFGHEGSHLWRIPIGGGVARPILSNMDYIFGPAVARHGARLAYVVGTENQNLWRIDLDGSTSPVATASPRRLVYSSRSQHDPMYSPDGRKLAFSSDRAGTDEIWTTDAEGNNPAQLTKCRDYSGSPRWSPDGSSIAFDSMMTGSPEIYVVPAEGGPSPGGRVRQITSHPPENVVPSWSSDGKWIYFSSNRSGEFQIWKVPAATGESPSTPAVQVTQGGGFDAFETADGRYLYFAKGRGKPGLWRRRLPLDRSSHEEAVIEQLQYWGLWALGPRGVYFLEMPASPHEKVHLKFFDLRSKRTAELSTLNKPLNPWHPAVALSPDGRHLVYEQRDNGGSNIAIVDNFR
jgi:Tol biopolymer transport system component/DNA-binding winged helix-turn-helix (wHTH) protein